MALRAARALPALARSALLPASSSSSAVLRNAAATTATTSAQASAQGLTAAYRSSRSFVATSRPLAASGVDVDDGDSDGLDNVFESPPTFGRGGDNGAAAWSNSEALDMLTPRAVVEQLDRHIIGQAEAKRAVAIALRNRWRRHRVPAGLRNEVVPKNILMIGPTGCGKTEIARRLAKLADAPFIKACDVEATKFTEVGFHGRDVDQIIRDLADIAIQLTRQKAKTRLKEQVAQAVENRLLDGIVGATHSSAGTQDRDRESFRAILRQGGLESQQIEIELSPNETRSKQVNLGEGGDITELWNSLERGLRVLKRGTGEKQKMTVSEWRPVLEDLEGERLLNDQAIKREAIQLVESDGIVFIDEIDKIVTPSDHLHGADASSEGVQRDLLPIIEGSAIQTRHGTVNTDHILFIASGAFHSCKPSDMLAELQGRLPIRVELKGLTRQDLYRILTEPENNLIKQQQLLLETEGVTLTFSDDAIREIARVAAEVNRSVENIGARRLHTILERVVEDISFSAPEKVGQAVVIDKAHIQTCVGDMLLKTDLSKFIL
eukprot:jgi/Chlat1/3196/Chrsp22S03418